MAKQKSLASQLTTYKNDLATEGSLNEQLSSLASKAGYNDKYFQKKDDERKKKKAEADAKKAAKEAQKQAKKGNILEQGLDAAGDFTGDINKKIYGEGGKAIVEGVKKSITGAKNTLDLVGAATEGSDGSTKEQLARAMTRFANEDLKSGKIDKKKYNEQMGKVKEIYKQESERRKNLAFMNQSREKTASEAAGLFLDVAGLKGGGQLIEQGLKQGGEAVASTGLKIAGKNEGRKRLEREAIEGAGFGAGYGANESIGDNGLEGDIAGLAGDTAIGAVLGGALGTALPALGRTVSGRKGSKVVQNADEPQIADDAAKYLDAEKQFREDAVGPEVKLLGDGRDSARTRLQEIEDQLEIVRTGNNRSQFRDVAPENLRQVGTQTVRTDTPETAERLSKLDSETQQIDLQIEDLTNQKADLLDQPRFVEEQKNLVMQMEAEAEEIMKLPALTRDNLLMRLQAKYEAANDELTQRFMNKDVDNADLDTKLSELAQKKEEIQFQAEEDLRALSDKQAEVRLQRQEEVKNLSAQELRALVKEKKQIESRLNYEQATETSPELPKRGPKATPEEKTAFKETVDNLEESVDNSNDIPSLVKGRVHFYDYFRPRTNFLKSIGAEKEAQLLEKSLKGRTKADYQDKIVFKDWAKALDSEESNLRVFQFLDGKKMNLTQNEQIVAAEIRAWLNGKAEAQGLNPETMIGDYITHLFKNTKDKKFDPDLAKLQEVTKPKISNKFLKKREGNEGYEEDLFAALRAYSHASNRNIYMKPAVEALNKLTTPKYKYVTDPATGKKKREIIGGGSVDDRTGNFITNYGNSITGQKNGIDKAMDNFFGGERSTKFQRKTRTLIYNATLGGNQSTWMNNLMQGVNTFTELGARDTASGYSQLTGMMADAARQSKSGQRVDVFDELFENGILDDNVLAHDASNANMRNKLLKTGNQILWAQFNATERMNRAVAYLGAKNQALRKGMDEEAAQQYAIGIVDKTQFRFNEVEIPAILDSELGKTLGQMQSFNIRQTGYVGGLLKGGARAGKNAVTGQLSKEDVHDIARLLRFSGATLGTAATIGQVTGYEWYDGIPFLSFRGVEPPMLKAGKTVVDALQGKDQYGNEIPLEENIVETGKDLFGLFAPGGTQIRKSAEGADTAAKGYSETAGGNVRFTSEQDPFTTAQNTIFGQYSTEGAREHYNRDVPYANAILGKPENLSPSESTIYKSASPARRKMYEEFFKATDKLETKSNTSKKVTELSKTSPAKALRTAAEYNATIDAQFAPLLEQYDGMIPEEIKKYIEDQKISADPADIRKRAKD